MRQSPHVCLIYFFGVGFSASKVTPLVVASWRACFAADEKRPRAPTEMPFDFKYSRFVAIVVDPF